MIIDFHTHIFPEKIAERTLGALSQASGITPYTDGTADGLRKSMSEAGISYSVNLPAITKPSQFESTNRFASEINGQDGLISFGGIHPDCDEPEDKLEWLKSLGLPGIKLHPDYQQCFVDDERYVRIIKHALKLDMMITIHAGLDNGFPELTHCTPDRTAHMLNLVYGSREPERPGIILAHMGGRMHYEEVNRLLARRNVYYDLSYILSEAEQEVIVRTVRAHGAERVLFGSDSPWRSQKEDVCRLDELPFTDREKELILGENARGILKL